MQISCLGGRFARHLSLDADEQTTLLRIEANRRTLPRGAIIRAEHGVARDAFVVETGWLLSSMLLDDGSRQILGLHVRGDIAGGTLLPWATAPYTLVAATEVTVCVVEKAALVEVYQRHPRLALMLSVLTEVERMALADRLAAIGRTSARSRVAWLLVDAYRRLRATGAAVADGFVLPLTQEEIGDATGLTAVHVNRMIRLLTDDKLIARRAGRLHVLDEARLAEIANHVDRFATIDTSWLPAG